MRPACVILAAGMGTRMNSDVPKVLHGLYGRPLLQYVIEAALGLNPSKIIIVVGKNRSLIEKSVSLPKNACFAVQEKPEGTAHAVLCATSALKGSRGTTLVLNGDMPLVREKTLRAFLSLHARRKNALSVASFLAHDPDPYGRIVRDKRGKAVKIVERTDATPQEKEICEVNSGLYAMEPKALTLLSKIGRNKAKGEYFITDALELALADGLRADAYVMGGEAEFMGINTRLDLVRAHEAIRVNRILDLIEEGVSFLDASSVFVHPSSRVGKGTLIYPNVFIDGNSVIGRDCVIYPGVRISESAIGDCSSVKDSSVIEGALVGTCASIGPFAHLRAGAEIGEGAKVGNFVEIKKSSIGKGSKAMHLSYIGDARVGRNVNIGAGTITCNYDGEKKHRTIIEDGVFVGSDTQLVAPVKVGKGSFIGAGSTITEDVPAGSLALSRTHQRNLRGWAKKKAAQKKAK